jgi:hypothetical protein
MKYILIFTSLFFTTFSSFAGRSSQVNILIGQETPDSGEVRSAKATLVKFSLTTEPTIFRFVTSFVVSFGTNYTQGDIGLGAQFYPLAYKSKSYVQPLLFAEGVFGVGSFDEKSRTDAGYELGAGLDFRLGKSGGINLSVSIKESEESSTRIWLGWFTTI